jgi:hypothetical protein
MELMTATGTSQQASQQGHAFPWGSTVCRMGLGSIRSQHALVFQVLLPRDIRGVMVL